MITLHILRVNLSRSLKILLYNISIAPQRAENIIEVTPTDRRYGVSLYKQRESPFKTGCVNIYAWTYLCTPVEYEVLPYLLSYWNCTEISEWDRISIT